MPPSNPSLVRRNRTLLTASAGAFLAFLDATIVNVAFPSIRDSFPGTTIGALSWVLNAYNIVFAAFLVVCGRLSDLLGRRRTFVFGLVLFTVASILCGLAPSVGLLIAARVLQALGAALLVPASLALVVDAFPEEKRSHAIGLWGAAAAVAAGLGPPLGGALVELGGWRAAFLVNLPLGAAAVLAAHSQLVESRAPGRRRLPDLGGAAVLALCLGVVNLALVKGNDWGWSSARTLGSFALGALLLGLFAVSSRRHPSPLLDPALMRVPSFVLANLATAVAGLGFFAYLLTNVLWLQYVWDYSVLRAGLALVPGAVVAAVVAAALGPVAQKRGYRSVVVPGAIVWAGAYVWYHQRAGVQPDFLAEWLPGQVLSGIGVGATLPVLGSAAMAAVPGGRFATASAVVSSARQLGGAIGIAVLVLLVGTPTPETVVGVLRNGWVLSAAAFVAVALLATPIGRLVPQPESEREDDLEPAVVHLPARAARPATPPPDGRSAVLAGLADVPMFAALPESARERLLAMSPIVHVAAGEALMEEGDPARSAFVVQSGRLQVFVGRRFVRELGPVAVLGELALLTGARRSATVRARRDTTLLEISKPDLESLLAADPVASRAVMTQLAERLSNPPPAALPAAARPSVVAVVGLHAGAGEPAVAERLVELLRRHVRVARLRHVDPEAV